MRAIVYSETGDGDVLRLTERPVPEPGPGEVRVRVVRSGVNPTDWKARRGTLSHPEAVPNQDGAGIVDATGPGVTGVAPEASSFGRYSPARRSTSVASRSPSARSSALRRARLPSVKNTPMSRRSVSQRSAK